MLHRLSDALPFLLTITLCACASRPLVVAATPTPPVPQYCLLHVEGRWVKDARGRIIILHGADLPTLSEMTASDRQPEQRLRSLADAGARVVRVPIDQSEITPTFVPAVVSPFIEQANTLGMLVILVYRNAREDSVRDQGNAAEDWLRLALTYLRNVPGAWFQPFDTPVDTPKWQAMNQRMVDVVRGFRANNIVVIGNPTWMKTVEPTDSLDGKDIVYAVTSLDGWPLDAAPFILTEFDGAGFEADAEADAEAVQAAQVWSIAAEAAQLAALSPLWQTSKSCE